MPPPAGFQKAELAIEGGDTIQCGFNPQSYSISKTNVWTFKPTTGVDLPDAEWGGGLPRHTKLSLLLDASLAGPDGTVKSQADALLKMMETGGGGGGGGSAPPFVVFQWGSVKLPKSAPVSISIQYLHFQPNGEPVRAMVDLELAQAEQADSASSGTSNANTNPHTYSQRGLRSHRVRDGDTLPSIAYHHYGDPNEWRTIALANDIDDPLRLRRGTDLTLPTLDS